MSTGGDVKMYVMEERVWANKIAYALTDYESTINLFLHQINLSTSPILLSSKPKYFI